MVTALGIKKDIRTTGQSIQTVDASNLTKAREPNAINSLVGKVAGLTIGASSELLGRPVVALRGNTDVLFVVDGIPINSDTWNISNDDIDTYTILKGASASALYGFRGKNGAILITTKRGSKDKRGFLGGCQHQSDGRERFSGLSLKCRTSTVPANTAFMPLVMVKGAVSMTATTTSGVQNLKGRLIPQYDGPVNTWSDPTRPPSQTQMGSAKPINFVSNRQPTPYVARVGKTT